MLAPASLEAGRTKPSRDSRLGAEFFACFVGVVVKPLRPLRALPKNPPLLMPEPLQLLPWLLTAVLAALWLFTERRRTRATRARDDSARALASLSQLLDWTAPLLKAGTMGLFPKGRDAEIELTEARKSWTFDVEILPSRTDSEARILRITSIESRS